MDLLIVSDLHVWGTEDPIYLSLLSLLRDRAQPGDIFVLAGDVFDLFVGNKQVFLGRYSEFMKELEAAGHRGVRLHYIEGNHDFLIRGAFSAVPGMTVHSKDFTLELGGRRFYLAHGDLANRKDYSYRALRTFFRSPMMRLLVKLCPGAWLDAFGRYSSETSRKRNAALPAELPIDRMESLRKIYRNHAVEWMTRGFDFVVMGHCHDLDEMFFNVGGRDAQYVNVGFPRVHGSFLSWSLGDEKIQREALPVQREAPPS